MRPFTAVAIATCITTSPVSAQGVDNGGQSGRRPLLPRGEEIALARSAAPPAVSDSATIYVLTDSAYVVAVKGTSGAACYVSRDWIASIEPHCFDPEGAATILPMQMHRVETASSRRVNQEGRCRSRNRRRHRRGPVQYSAPPAMSYMMSAEQETHRA